MANLECCYFCKTPLDKEIVSVFNTGVRTVTCKFCGKYKIEHDISEDIDSTLNEDEKHYLSCYIRESNEYERPLVEITLDNIDSLIPPPLTMLEKADKIIQYLGWKSKEFGEYVPIYLFIDYSVAYAKSNNEFHKLLRYLDASVLITTPDIDEGSRIDVSLTMEGWQKFEELKTRQPDSKQCFVAMSFHPSLENIYEQGIKKAIKEAGYEPIRSDRQEHNEKICDKIMADIRKSRFIVADVTKQNQGAYFEAGFALGLNITVIWLCEQKEIDEKKLHFDTQQFKHIGWTNPEDLYTKLLNRINATIV